MSHGARLSSKGLGFARRVSFKEIAIAPCVWTETKQNAFVFLFQGGSKTKGIDGTVSFKLENLLSVLFVSKGFGNIFFFRLNYHRLAVLSDNHSLSPIETGSSRDAS